MRLKPFNVTVALLPISGGNIDTNEAAQLAEDIGATWVVPMHYGSFEDNWDHPDTPRVNRFIEHMLGHRPLQKFKVFEIGEGWTVPSEAAAVEAGG